MNETHVKILVVDDEEGMRHSIRALLKQQGYECAVAVDGEDGLRAIESEGPFDAILCDLRMPKLDGLEFVERITKLGVQAPLVIMSAYGTIDLAVEAMQRGAFSFISKPFKPNEIIVVLQKALAHDALLDENKLLREEKIRHYRFEELIGRDEKMVSLFDSVKKIAPYKTSVLIHGESGTGKELVARSIHRLSTRVTKPFIAINCGAIPETLLESELFGHVKGAFTDARTDKAGLFAEADGGTLFLDEVGETPLHLQVKLLRALQEEEIRPVGGTQSLKIDVRIVAATKQNLEDLIALSKFREDLYYRLSVFPVYLPPLRDRPGDIPLLVEHFCDMHSKRLGVKVRGVREKAMSLLMEYSWPGNVRELENVLERAIVLAGGHFIEPNHLQEKIRAREILENIGVPKGLPIMTGELSIKANSREIEELLIRKALEKTRGNRTTAARVLEISLRTLLYKIQEFKITDL
jgi:two-component system, NtrC family, response regulator AtoC